MTLNDLEPPNYVLVHFSLVHFWTNGNFEFLEISVCVSSPVVAEKKLKSILFFIFVQLITKLFYFRLILAPVLLYVTVQFWGIRSLCTN